MKEEILRNINFMRLLECCNAPLGHIFPLEYQVQSLEGIHLVSWETQNAEIASTTTSDLTTGYAGRKLPDSKHPSLPSVTSSFQIEMTTWLIISISPEPSREARHRGTRPAAHTSENKASDSKLTYIFRKLPMKYVGIHLNHE